MKSKNRFLAAFTLSNSFAYVGRKIKPFVIAFTMVFLFLSLQLSLTFAQGENTNITSKFSAGASPQNPIPTRDAKPDSSSKKEERERRFSAKSGSEGVTISVLKDEDLDPSTVAQSESIDEAQFYIHIANNTKKKLPLLQIPTGIKEGTLNYIRVEGATGYLWKNTELVLAYVSLLPDASTTVTVTGLPIISPAPVSLDINPRVQDSDSHIISTGPTAKKLIGGKKFSFVDRFKIGERVDKTNDGKNHNPVDAASNLELTGQ